MITKSRVHENVEDITEVLNSKKIKDKIDEMQERGDVKATVIIQDDKKISLKNLLNLIIKFLKKTHDHRIDNLKVHLSPIA